MAESFRPAEEIVAVSAGSDGTPQNSMDDPFRIINLDHGDPTMYEKFWKETGESSLFTTHGWENMSYFSDPNQLCWFLHPMFAKEICRIHHLVGNALVDDDYHIVIGNGSSQLFLAALFALCTEPGLPEPTRPIPVVSAAPYYSGYPTGASFLQSALYTWEGDANSFDDPEVGLWIEVVCRPNNPDGLLNRAVLRQKKKKKSSKEIHDLAYYWPQYTAITSAAEEEIMLFTMSKCTGHAGSRLGWALVKDGLVAARMTKFVELTTIGVSKDAQLRASVILRAAFDSPTYHTLFDFGRKAMAHRWHRLRTIVHRTRGLLSLPDFPPPALCRFSAQMTPHLPAFAWIKYEGDEIEDLASFLKTRHNILTRSGKYFGADKKHIRISLVDRDEAFNIFIQRFSSIFNLEK